MLLYKLFSLGNITEAEIRVYYREYANSSVKRDNKMNAEIKELNRMICKNCDVKDYKDCKKCRVYQLINKIASQ